MTAIGDEKSSVRSNGCRLLGVLVLFKNLSDDPLFLSDAICMLESLKSNDVLVKTKSSWALGNITDTLSLLK